MFKKITLFGFTLFLAFAVISCKQKQISVNPGAVVSKDGTKDGLASVQENFSDAKKTDKGIFINLSSDLLFPTNSSYLTNEAKLELDKLAGILKNNPTYKVKVDGHTDATGTEQYNMWLSEKRANSVKIYLVESTISSSRISTQGFGQVKPIADNKTSSGRQKNRRVEILITE